MAAPMVRVVGWIDKSEWENVYEELFSDDPVLQRHALDRISVWKCRLLHKLSTAIECTWQLLSVKLQYQQALSNVTSNAEDQHLRMAFSMALVRFVNLLTEKGQTKQYAKPVHILAEELGLPEWLVELRHEATHSNLPSLYVLQRATDVALSWLKREYWDAQNGEVERSILTMRPEEKISKLLKDFMQEQYQLIDRRGSGSDTNRRQLRLIIEELEDISQCHREMLICELVSPGYLIPTEDQMSSLNIQSKDFMTTALINFPEVLIHFWKSILRLIHKMHGTYSMLECLSLKLENDVSLQSKLVAGWLWNLLEAVAHTRRLGSNDCSKVVKQLYQQPCVCNERSLLEICIRKPGPYSAFILPQLFKIMQPKLEPEQEQNLLELTKIYVSGTQLIDLTHEDGSGKENGSQELCPKDIRSLQEFIEGNGCQGKSCEKSKPWKPSLSDSRVWANCSIGNCPGLSLSWKNLELPAYVDELGVDKRQMKTYERHQEKWCTAISNRHQETVEMVDRSTVWKPEEMTELRNQILLF